MTKERGGSQVTPRSRVRPASRWVGHGDTKTGVKSGGDAAPFCLCPNLSGVALETLYPP